jgi:excisionase family DNA binding protein
MPANLVLTESDAAAYLRISIRDLGRLVAARAIPFIELPGGQIRFDLEDLAAWCRTRRRDPVAGELVPSDRMQRTLSER